MRRRTVVILVATLLAIAMPVLPASAAAPPTYCSTLLRILDPQSAAGLISKPDEMKNIAKALKSSNPPAEIKQAVNDFADALNDLAGKIVKAGSGTDAKSLAKEFGKGSKYQNALRSIVTYETTTCRGTSAATTVATTAKPDAGSIPDSAAMSALAKNIPGNTKAIRVVAACNLVVVLELQQDVTKKNDPSLAGRVTAVSAAVAAIDPRVGAAIAKASAKSASNWCKKLGFANG